MTNALNTIASRIAGTSDTRAVNQLWWMNSRQAHGGRTNCTMESRDIATKPPISRSGLASVFVATISSYLRVRSSSA